MSLTNNENGTHKQIKTLSWRLADKFDLMLSTYINPLQSRYIRTMSRFSQHILYCQYPRHFRRFLARKSADLLTRRVFDYYAKTKIQLSSLRYRNFGTTRSIYPLSLRTRILQHLSNRITPVTHVFNTRESFHRFSVFSRAARTSELQT